MPPGSPGSALVAAPNGGTMETTMQTGAAGGVPGARKRFRPYRDLDHGIATCPWLLDRARRVLLALMGYVDEAGVCWPSVALLAREVSADVRTVKRALADLRGAGIVARAARGVFRVNLQIVASIAGGDSAVPSGDSAVTSKGTRVSPPRGHGCPSHLLRELKIQEHTHTEPEAAAPGEVCVLGEKSREQRVQWVAEAFPLPRSVSGSLVIPPPLHDAIARACEDYTPAVVRRSVELVGSKTWRSADLGAWVFTSASFGACVLQAQAERRRAAASRPKVLPPAAPATREARPSAEELGAWKRAIGG